MQTFLLLNCVSRNEAIESVLCLHASADAKAELFKERFTVLHQVVTKSFASLVVKETEGQINRQIDFWSC